MIVNAPMLIIITVLVLVVTLVIFSAAVEEVVAKEKELGKIEDTAVRISRIVQVSSAPVISLRSCTIDNKRTEFSYNFLVSGLEASYQGIPGETKDLEMGVFATLAFKNSVVRDKNNKMVTLKKDSVVPFGELEFDVKDSGAPFILSPDDTGFIGTVKKDQSVVVNNYRVMPFRQFRPFSFPLASCYTDFIIECKSGSAKASLISCKDDPKNPQNCRSSLVLCGGRVDLSLPEYESGTCGSRLIKLIVQTNKQTEGWEYADSATIYFWRDDAAKDLCWQKSYSEGCREKFLGSYLFNLSAEIYNVGDKYNPKGCLWTG